MKNRDTRGFSDVRRLLVQPLRAIPGSLSALAPLFLSVSLVFGLSVAGCGYALVGTGQSAIPETVKTVYVSTFINDTTTVGLEQRLTDAVIRELSARRRLTPVSDRTKADAELEGRIMAYGLLPVRFDSDGRALEYQISVTARLKLVEKSTEKVLFEDPGFLFRQPYTVPDSSRSYYNQETQAIDEMSLPFARSLVSSILEGF